MYSPCQHPLAGAAMLTVLRRSACFSFGSYWLKEQLERCCQRTGVKVIRIHDVRHSHASLLIHMGTNAVLVQKRLRHKRISTTLGTYAHLYPDCSEQVAEQLEALGEATVKKEPKEKKKKKKREPVTNLLPQTKKAPFFRS